MTLDSAATAAVCIYAADKALGWSIGLYRLANRKRREAEEFAEQTRLSSEASAKSLQAALQASIGDMARAQVSALREAAEPTQETKPR